MAQEKYFRLSHFKPKGYPEVYPGSSAEVKAMMPSLIETVSRRWTRVPGYALEAFATRNRDVPYLAFKKKEKEVYVHIFCNEFVNPLYAIQIVCALYEKLNLGQPAFVPEEPNWIHTIPLADADLTAQETLLIHQVAHSLFWTIFMDYKRTFGA